MLLRWEATHVEMAKPELARGGSGHLGGNPYANFVAVAGTGVGTTSTPAAKMSMPPYMAVAAARQQAPSEPLSAFAFARQVLTDNDEWKAKQAQAQADREERIQVMRVACAPQEPEEPPAPAPASPRPKLSKPEALRKVESETGLPMDRCKFYLEESGWDAEKAIATYLETTKASMSPDQVQLVFKLPDGKQVNELFRVSQTPFDIYAKVYDLLTNKDADFKMVATIAGSEKELDEATWSSTLQGIDMKGQNVYIVQVTQAGA